MIRWLFLAVLLQLPLTLPVPALAQPTPVVRLDVSEGPIYVGQPAKVTITVLVPTWLKGELPFPSYDQEHAITRALRPSGSKSGEVNGETWFGASRDYLIYPMQPGATSFPAGTLTVSFSEPETHETVNVDVPLKGFTINATIPKAAQALDPLIVARTLSLEQTWKGTDGNQLNEGEAVTRTVTAKIEGSSALFLPLLISPISEEFVRIYANEPNVRDGDPNKGAMGDRSETATYVARYGGDLVLPDIELRWFNLTTQKVETAFAAGRTYEIDAPAKPVEPLLTRKQIVTLVAFVAIAILFLWAFKRWVWPSLTVAISNLRFRWLQSETRAAQKVQQAINRQDLQRVFVSLEHWRRFFPDPDKTLEDALSDALFVIGRARYSSGTSADWRDIQTKFRALRAANLKRKRRTGKARKLPAMNPF